MRGGHPLQRPLPGMAPGVQPGVSGGLPRCGGKTMGKLVIGFSASVLGWKLNPVVGAVYGPEFYAGKGPKGGGADVGGPGWAWGEAVIGQAGGRRGRGVATRGRGR